MPMGKGTYGSMRGRPAKSAKMKKQAATAIAMKKKGKKPKRRQFICTYKQCYELEEFYLQE